MIMFILSNYGDIYFTLNYEEASKAYLNYICDTTS